MERECKNDGCDFIVGLGDNFYSYGVMDANDPRFQASVKIYYKALSQNEWSKGLRTKNVEL